MSEISITVSDDCEGTSYPWWVIIDPRQMMKKSIHKVASMIDGPFFSRDEALRVMQSKPHHYSDSAGVYCMSGYASTQYRQKLDQS